MSFDSFIFVVFLFIVCITQVFTPSWQLRKSLLLAFSCLFYAAWSPPLVLLLLISILINWTVGQRIDSAAGKIEKRLWLILSLVANLGLLAYFKYGTFLYDNWAALASSLGITVSPRHWDIILPIGISFYTFHGLSYSLDIFYGRFRAWDSLVDFALYITFFPQLVAGPIVRSGQFFPQCESPRSITFPAIASGCIFFIIGLFQKCVLADSFLSPIVEKVYDSSKHADFVSCWVATLAFSLQIFFDFSGYSTCAIGAARCLGFELPVNFHSPYGATGFSDFWRRWHITLSTWLRDYLYIPLGGSRGSRLRTGSALFVTMLLGGLWHGAAWKFAVWGLGHGGLLTLEHSLRRTGIRVNSGPVRVLAAFATFLVVTCLWTLFRANDLHAAFRAFQAMAGLGSSNSVSLVAQWETWMVLWLTAITFCWQFITSDVPPFYWITKTPWAILSLLVALMLYMILISIGGDDHAFIYFQF